jgi:hypothetical protein
VNHEIRLDPLRTHQPPFNISDVRHYYIGSCSIAGDGWHLYLLSFGNPLTDALDQLTPLITVNEVVDEGPHFVHDASLFECYSSDFVFHAPYSWNEHCLFL